MLLSEAKELLRNNGYRLVKEAYDAVRDHQLTKKNGHKEYIFDSGSLEKGISEMLNSKKIFNKMGKRTVDTDNFVEDKRGEEIFEVIKFEKHPGIFLAVDTNIETAFIPGSGETTKGSESGDWAAVRRYDDYVILYLISEERNRQTVLDAEKFNVRNVPGMVSWIIKTLKNF